MIVGIGSDIVSIRRMERKMAKGGDAIARRVLVDHEWLQYQESSQKAALLAKRFAVKEAAAKALGTGFAQGITWQHISTQHDALGKPILALTDAALLRAKMLGVDSYHLTLTDERKYAVAFVVLEGTTHGKKLA